MPVIPWMKLTLTVLSHMYLASHKRDTGKQSHLDQSPQNAVSDQELQSLLTGNNIRNRIKMKQDTWQPLTDKWSRPIDKDGIFLDQWLNHFTVCAKRL